MSESTSSGGINIFGLLGVVGAVLLSWEKWHSIGWAIVNGAFGWFYLLYYWLRYA